MQRAEEPLGCRSAPSAAFIRASLERIRNRGSNVASRENRHARANAEASRPVVDETAGGGGEEPPPDELLPRAKRLLERSNNHRPREHIIDRPEVELEAGWPVLFLSLSLLPPWMKR